MPFPSSGLSSSSVCPHAPSDHTGLPRRCVILFGLGTSPNHSGLGVCVLIAASLGRGSAAAAGLGPLRSARASLRRLAAGVRRRSECRQSFAPPITYSPDFHVIVWERALLRRSRRSSGLLLGVDRASRPHKPPLPTGRRGSEPRRGQDHVRRLGSTRAPLSTWQRRFRGTRN